jgi:hypothetical protein
MGGTGNWLVAGAAQQQKVMNNTTDKFLKQLRLVTEAQRLRPPFFLLTAPLK